MPNNSPNEMTAPEFVGHLRSCDGGIMFSEELNRAANLIEELMEENLKFQRVLKFLHAYEMGDAVTFVDPNNGDLISANYEARALASAALQGPATG